eukprot:COSAG02_NODE_142_length_34188_cov_183.180791_12_plen_74_part_00
MKASLSATLVLLWCNAALLSVEVNACESSAGQGCSFDSCCSGLYCEDVWSGDVWCANARESASRIIVVPGTRQ